MRVYIWAHKDEVRNLKITEWYYTRPYFDRSEEWVQISVSHDTFVIMEDKLADSKKEPIKEHKTKLTGKLTEREASLGDIKKDEWLVGQYNRNREHIDKVTNVKDINSKHLYPGEL